MEVKKIGGKGNVLELEFTNTTAPYMNTLRRLIINDVPTLAIELVEFSKNTGIMYDEMVAHRFGLVPLATPIGDYALPSQEEMKSHEFSAKSSVTGTLKVSGPCTVYAKDLKFKDAKVKPIFPDTPIAKLLEGQEIELSAIAVLGQGKTHVKWSPGHAYYHEVPNIKGKSMPVADERGQISAGAYDKVDEKDIEKKTGHFFFRIESWGQLKPQDILTSALDELNNTLKEFDSLIKSA